MCIIIIIIIIIIVVVVIIIKAKRNFLTFKVPAILLFSP